MDACYSLPAKTKQLVAQRPKPNSQTPERTLPIEDAAAIIRLLGDVAAEEGSHTVQKERLMNGLCRLVGGDAWIWCLGVQMKAGEQPVYTSFLHGGFTEQRFANYLTAIEHPDMADLTAPMLGEMSERNTHLTRLRQQIGSTASFENSKVYPLWCAADIGPIILSLRPLGDGSVVCVAVYRSQSLPLFDERECRIMHILLTEVPWLHELGWPEDRGVTVPRLGFRERLVLNLLLEGRTRANIAEHMGITINTANTYVKDLFRHFRVHSQPELMARFRQSDGGDLGRIITA